MFFLKVLLLPCKYTLFALIKNLFSYENENQNVMRFWQLKNLKEFVETVCLSEKYSYFCNIIKGKASKKRHIFSC